MTVIEKDIDGLTGWWLCLLHGQQGIVPGNRLKVIPPVELDQFEKTSSNTHINNANKDEHVDSLDGVPSNYDYLPNPVKTPGLVPTLSIKDMFHIPFKTSGENKEVYDVPSSLNSTQEIYDVPSSKEKIDVSTSRSSGYDSPRSSSATNLPTKNVGGGTMETYDVPSSLQNLSTLGRTTQQQHQQYSVPSSLPNLTTNTIQCNRSKSKSDLEVDQLMDDILDSPFNEEPNVSTIKRSPMNSNNSTPRSSFTSVNEANRNSNPNMNGAQEIYDVPKKDSQSPGQQQHSGRFQKKNLHLQSPATNSLSHTLPRGFSPRTNSLNNLPGKPTPTRLQEIYDIPSTTIAANRSLPGTPVSSRRPMQADVQTSPALQQEIYDVPAPRANHQDPINNPEFMSMLHQLERQESFSSQKRDSNGSLFIRNSMGSSSKRGSRESFQTPPQSRNSTEFYDVPTHRSPRNSSRCNNTNAHHEIYDVPPSNSNGVSTQEIYDVPPVKNNVNSDVTDGQELYDVPPNQTSTPRGQELYDVPPLSNGGQELYDVPPSKTTIAQQQETYDVPPKKQSSPLVQQEIYDVPSTHNLNQVMADAAYSSHKGHRNHNNNNNNLLTTPDVIDDDYVDYHDIWTKEPPKELVHLHDKVRGF